MLRAEVCTFMNCYIVAPTANEALPFPPAELLLMFESVEFSEPTSSCTVCCWLACCHHACPLMSGGAADCVCPDRYVVGAGSLAADLPGVMAEAMEMFQSVVTQELVRR